MKKSPENDRALGYTDSKADNGREAAGDKK